MPTNSTHAVPAMLSITCSMYRVIEHSLTAHLLTCFSVGSLVQRSVERVTLGRVPLDFMCDAVGFFEHVKELKCTLISAPQQVCLAV